MMKPNLHPQSPDRLPALIEKLKRHGHRITPQRVAILKAVMHNQGHPTVEQVYAAVRRDYPMTSLATVYKTLDLMKEENEVIELGYAGSSRFDGANPMPHPHLICTQCQRIIDLETNPTLELPQELGEKYGFKISTQRVDYYGLCPECQARNQPAS